MKVFTTWLLDGWLGSPRRLARLQRNLSPTPGSCRIWNYDTSGHSSLESLALNLSSELAASPDPVNLVGFSMGGIVIREALRQNPALPVRSITCLNTPHHGTAPALFLSRTALRELRPGCPFLQRLNNTRCPVPFLNLWCPGDLVVIPGRNARHPEADEEICSWMPAHVWPLFSGDLHRTIKSFLDSAPSKKTVGQRENLQMI